MSDGMDQDTQTEKSAVDTVKSNTLLATWLNQLKAHADKKGYGYLIFNGGDYVEYFNEGLTPEEAFEEELSSMTGSVEMLRELMDACSPYLKRKKMTPRHECNELNRVWAKCAEHLEKQNEQDETRSKTNMNEVKE